MYARICETVSGGCAYIKKFTNLGKVIDKEAGIFENRELGLFSYDIKTNTYGNVPDSFVMPVAASKRGTLDVSFGDVFFLDKFIKQIGFDVVLDAISYRNPDTLKTMISYYALRSDANCLAQTFWNFSYAHILYPNAKVSSQRISDFLVAIGDEHHFREFSNSYITYLKNSKININSVILDSSGLPNDIKFHLTKVRNYSGDISNEVRLIYVIEQTFGIPIYFRYCYGNIIDTSTLIRTFAELLEIGVNVKFAIVDAGYYSKENILYFYDNNIDFLTRLKANTRIYKEIILKYSKDLDNLDYHVSYNGRDVFIMEVPCFVYGNRAYAYISRDETQLFSDRKSILKKFSNQRINKEDGQKALDNSGIFVLISSKQIPTLELLSFYYLRQQVEEVFDIAKNYVDIIPLRIHSENAFRGHLLISFIVSILLRKMQIELNNFPFSPLSLLKILRDQRCKVYDSRIITYEPNAEMNQCYNIFNIDCPATIDR
jgi:hypothetical protein